MRNLFLALIASVLLAAAASAAPPQANVLRATGIGKPPRNKPPVIARLMARRAAEVVAVRNLAYKLHVRNTKTRPPRYFSTTIAGFRYLPPVYHRNGTVEVTVERKLPSRR